MTRTYQLLVRCLLVASMLVLVIAPGYSQEIDDVFSEPDAVTDDGNGGAEESAESPEEPENVVDIDALTTSPTTVTGRVSSSVGLGLGLLEWPGSDAAEDEDLEDLARYDVLFEIKSSITVDSRPEPYLRFRTRLSTELDEADLDFTRPEVDELFVDYTFGESVFVRAGKYSMKWGRARLFDNPADLVSRVDDGAALRGTFPAGPGSITALIYSRPEWLATYGEETDWRAFGGASQWESTWGPLTTELSGHYQHDEPVGSALGLTLGAGEFTVTAEGVYNWDQDDPAGGPVNGQDSYQAVTTVFWENGARSWSILGEYQYDSNDSGGGEHLAGFSVRGPSVFRRPGWRPGVRWKHALEDGSGEVIPGISGEIAPDLDLSIGVPVIYGEPGTYYREALSSDDDEDDDDEDLVPFDRVVTVLFGLSLRFRF